jgi:hypothetical protein
MATKSELDSKTDTDALPSYDAISFIQSKRQSAQSAISWMLGSKQILTTQSRITALSRIRELVTGPDVTPSSVAPIVNSCAADLSAAKFSVLLQSRNVEGHSAIYWALMNDKPEALSAFTGFISKISSSCRSELRIACMETSNNAAFMQLNLGRTIGRKCIVMLTGEILD